MIDISLLRERPELARDMLKKRNLDFPLDGLLQSELKRRELQTRLQELRHRRNLASEAVANAKKQGQEAAEMIAEMKDIAAEIEATEEELRAVEPHVQELLMRLPNILHESVPLGRDENDNVVVRSWGTAQPLTFEPKDHIDIGYLLGVIDVERAAKVAGSRFYYLLGDLVRLDIALLQFGLDLLRERGFTPVLTPYLLKADAMAGALILSEAVEDMIYKVEGEDLYLIGTAEHSIAAMHMDEILDGSELPQRYAGVSPCFRKEAGAHGRDTKGIFRVHQFEKVEQFVSCRPEDSWDEHERLVQNVEEVYQRLHIPYRVVLLCTGDTGKVAAKTYDVEAWLPGQRKYREMASCSNCTDYQARRLKIRFRDKPSEEPRLVHTLNSTLIAAERTAIAILENYQREDGSVEIPNALKPYLGALREIVPSKTL